MTEFKVNSYRHDPYKNFKFRVKFGKDYVAGVSQVSPLSKNTEVVRHRSGGDPSGMRLSPGQTEYSAITLERGITFDVAFEQWANKTWYLSNTKKLGQEVSLKDFRKDIQIELLNEAGQVVRLYNVYRAWVSEYTAMPELDGSGNAVAIESITIQNEGWERDDSVAEAAEPSYTQPKTY